MDPGIVLEVFDVPVGDEDGVGLVPEDDDADPMWVFHFRGVDLPGLLRDRGIDLDKSVSLFEPDPLVWLALADPKGEAEEGDGEALPLLEEIEGGYLKRLASLLPASVEGGKALSRYRYEKLVAPVMTLTSSGTSSSPPSQVDACCRNFSGRTVAS